MTGSSFLARAFVSWKIHDLENSQGDGISVHSRGFVSPREHVLENVFRLGSMFLAGALVLWENHRRHPLVQQKDRTLTREVRRSQRLEHARRLGLTL